MITQTDTTATTDTKEHQEAPRTPEDGGATPDTSVPAVEPQEAREEPKEGDQADPTAKLRKEAAGHRVAAKEARAEAETLRTERDALAAQLSAAQDSILADRLAPHGVTLDALVAAGHRDTVFNEDGTLNEDALNTAMTQAKEQFGYRPVQRPDSFLGRETPPTGGSGGASWADVLNGR